MNIQLRDTEALSKVRSLITLLRVKQLHRMLIRFSRTENIVLINTAGRLCVSAAFLCESASHSAALRSVNLISVCACSPVSMPVCDGEM